MLAVAEKSPSDLILVIADMARRLISPRAARAAFLLAALCPFLASYAAAALTDAADPLYRQALAIVRKALGEDHPDYATCLNNLALLYDAMGRHAEAETALRHLAPPAAGHDELSEHEESRPPGRERCPRAMEAPAQASNRPAGR